jgi:iron complex outermembrane receptor protein
LNHKDIGMKLGSDWKKVQVAVIGATGALFSFGALGQTEDAGETGANAEKAKKAEVMQVTGSRIKQIDLEAAGSMTTFDRKAIEKSGYSTVADFLRNSIPSGSMVSENETLSQVSGASNFAGRDFTSEYTLVLLNGRRLPINAIAADFVDLNLIPMAAVERIEYLTDGASAIYGSDAVAGVLNIITRKNFEGVSVTGRIGQAERGDGTETSYQIVGGTSSDRGNFLIAADFFKREPVMANSRPLIKSAVSPDGTDGRSPNGLPGYIIRADGSIEAFDDCPADQLDGSGRCQYDFGPLYQVNPKTDRQSLYTVFDYQLTDAVNFFGEARFSRSFTHIANGAAPGGVSLAADAPSNPHPGEEITVVRRYLDFGPRRQDASNEAFSTVAGLRGDLGLEHSWSLEVTSHQLRNLQVGAGGNVNSPAASDAFNDGTLNPFVFNTFDSEAKLAAYDKINTTTFREGVSNLQTYNLTFDGSLPFNLPGGSMAYATGLEYRQESFVDRADNLSKEDKIIGSASSDGKGDRENSAAFFELALPVLSNLDLSVAGRYDEIDNKQEKFTYKLAGVYAPVDVLKLRASYGTGFKAPAMHELYLGTSFGVNQAVDEATCGDDEPCEINVKTGGNKDLLPEESVAYNFGVLGQLTDSLSLRLDYWDISIDNKVDELSVQKILNDEDRFLSLIQRDPNGRLNTSGAFVETNLQNLTEESSAGIEFAVNYANKTSYGHFTSSLLLNKLVKSKSQETATDPLCDFSDLSSLDARLNLDWTNQVVGAGTTVRYYGGYTSYSGGLKEGTCEFANPESKFEVEDAVETDLRLSYVAPFGSELNFGVINAFDNKPAYDKNAGWPWYNQQKFSNMGRYFYLSATHEFR